MAFSSSSLPPAIEYGEYRNWAELPPELTSSILHRFDAAEILEKAQKVCISWCRVCKDPSMWQKIEMGDYGLVKSIRYDILCRHAVDRSQGGLVEIDIWHFGTDSLLNYIADRSSNLRSLRFEMNYSITNKGFAEAVVKLPLLEYLEDYSCSILSGEFLKVAGQSCPNLKTLKLNFPFEIDVNDDEVNNEALAIAESMPKLRHLQIFGYRLTNTGLTAILDGCPHLEHLDLRKCCNIDLVGDLEKRCSERIRDLRRPDDSTADHPLAFSYPDYGSVEEEEEFEFEDEEHDYSYGSDDT